MSCSLKMFIGLLLVVLPGCEILEEPGEEDSEVEIEQGPEAVISSTNVENIIAAGRAKIGTVSAYPDQCKGWVRGIVHDTYGPTIPATDDPAAPYRWVSEPPPATVTKMAQWVGSYANGRLPSSVYSSLAANAYVETTVSVPNSDSQIIVLYASRTNVTARITKGSTTLSVSSASTDPQKGAISSSTVSGSGTWTLRVTNNNASYSANYIAVVLSRSRFVSDWETARRGDIMQMYYRCSSAFGGTIYQHTTFVQTNYNSKFISLI